MRITLEQLLSIAILLITISSVSYLTILPLNNIILWWGINAGILILIASSKKYYYDTANDQYIYVLLFYLFWNIICVARGFFVAENYWEWKNLVGTSMILMLPLTIYITTNSIVLQNMVGTWVKIALPAFFLFLPLFTFGEALGHYLAPIGFLLLFFPVLSNKWKLVVSTFALIVILGYLDGRSSVIKFSLAFAFSLLYFFRGRILLVLFRFLRTFLLIAPVVFFLLGISNIFNVFRISDYVEGNYTTTVIQNGVVEERSLIADTRTMLYEEVLSSAIKHDYVFFGRTPARGNESSSFGMHLADELKTGKMERFSNEVSILNIFTWTGLLGVVLYFLIFYKASLLAIKYSNNWMIRIIGLFVAFRWSYAWVEDFSSFDLSYIFLWIMLGMCFSKSIRGMTDLEMEFWIKGLFDKKYKTVNIYKKIVSASL